MTRARSPGHNDPASCSRALVDLTVAVADGGSTVSEIALLADQAAVSDRVASDSTCWRLLDQIDDRVLACLASARARTREVV